MFYSSHHWSLQQSSKYHYLHLTEKDTDAWRCFMICSRSKGCTLPLSTIIYCGQSSVKYSNSEDSLTQTTLVFNFLRVSFNLFTFFIGTITISICPSSSVIHQKRQKNRSLKTLRSPLQTQRKYEVEETKAGGKKTELASIWDITLSLLKWGAGWAILIFKWK